MSELHFEHRGEQADEACVLNSQGQVVARFYSPASASHAAAEVRRRDGIVGRLLLASGGLISATYFLFLCGSRYAANGAVVIPTIFTGVLVAVAVSSLGYHCYQAGRRRELSVQALQLRLPSLRSEFQTRSSVSGPQV